MAIGAGPEIERLMALLSKLPGLGPRSARRAALALLKRREQLLIPLTNAMQDAADKVESCRICGALSTQNPCATCADPARDKTMICVVEEDSALWAMERVGAFSGRYHVLGGLLSALDGVRPEDLRIDGLVERVRAGHITEVIMALPATVEGQTTAHYVADRLRPLNNGVQITYLARGVPVGGELDWLDDGTISHAFKQRR
ncbi:recombination mediator RecR [Asticcacaulis sp. SL142]|uniref:recombination mediator RecR n=1 Tax=Asticcacaulis sp. SL142 TaxID=2995155 RepID=UPI00226CC4ED|nr:recombination mediator RecR [Asticcacaulis sp. SL142]WAC47718.1 recombination mediator RecR [Asticcacaulis sp. SL142]